MLYVYTNELCMADSDDSSAGTFAKWANENIKSIAEFKLKGGLTGELSLSFRSWFLIILKLNKVKEDPNERHWFPWGRNAVTALSCRKTLILI
jgi:hypothetical protein